MKKKIAGLVAALLAAVCGLNSCGGEAANEETGSTEQAVIQSPICTVSNCDNPSLGSKTCFCGGTKCLLRNTPTCSDTCQDFAETDVDCGGSTCTKCANGKKCLAASDCQSLICTNGYCVAPVCGNGICEPNEANVCCADCGASTCTTAGQSCLCGKCGVQSCTDVCKDGKETDVDCGGGTCSKCANGKHCSTNNDCQSLICTNGTCVPPVCGNGYCEPNEPGTCCADCGGDAACGSGYYCGSAGTCVKTTCGNGVCEPNEANVCCADCGKTCSSGQYCSSATGTCTSPVCGNGICEQGEAGVCCDCGCAAFGPSYICDSGTQTCYDPAQHCRTLAQMVDQAGCPSGSQSDYWNCVDNVLNSSVANGNSKTLLNILAADYKSQCWGSGTDLESPCCKNTTCTQNYSDCLNDK